MTQKERLMPDPLEQKLGRKQPYWVVVNGGKTDFTVKHWHPSRMQWVVSQLRNKVHFVQTGLSEHMHHGLKGSNITSLMDCMGRDFIRLIYHAEGVICGITYAMHLAAAVPCRPIENRIKPCVVIAGGREAHHWEAYNGHRFLDTIGSLPCCANGGCWKARVVKLGDGEPNDEHLCVLPTKTENDIMLPRCMDMIKPQDVLRAVESYLECLE
jgi:ADP-heptose:LPS heptosyltransferase